MKSVIEEDDKQQKRVGKINNSRNDASRRVQSKHNSSGLLLHASTFLREHACSKHEYGLASKIDTTLSKQHNKIYLPYLQN